ncbi:MAG: hypothetical protein M3Y33_02125 [Actinomycetota bacterium]|nr:hypothetical protein [Actinomycetota bacterium]
MAEYGSPHIEALGDQGTTFVGQETAAAFDEAVQANLAAWLAFQGAVTAELVRRPEQGLDPAAAVVAISGPVAAARSAAYNADREVFRLIRLDVTYTEYTRLGPGHRDRQIFDRADVDDLPDMPSMSTEMNAFMRGS